MVAYAASEAADRVSKQPELAMEIQKDSPSNRMRQSQAGDRIKANGGGYDDGL